MFIGDMNMLHLPRSLIVQLESKDDNNYLNENYDPPWYNEAKNKNIECYDMLLYYT